MINSILEELKDKNVAILGFGIEGRSTYNFIRRYSDMKLTIIDKVNISDNLNNVDIIYGENYLDDLDKQIDSKKNYVDPIEKKKMKYIYL